MPEVSTQTCSSSAAVPQLLQLLEEERRSKANIKVTEKQKTSVKVSPESIENSQLGRPSTVVIERLSQIKSVTTIEEKDRGPRIALLPSFDVCTEYYAYKDSVAEKLFGERFRMIALNMWRHRPLFLTLINISLCSLWILCCYILFVPVSKAKCFALSTFVFTVTFVNWVPVSLTAYPLVKRIFSSFDGLFLTANLGGFLAACGLFCFKTYDSTVHALPFFMWLITIAQIPMFDLLPVNIKTSNRRFLTICYGIFACSIFVMVIMINLYAARGEINEEWVFVGQMKISLVRSISTFGMNCAILFGKYTVYLLYHPDSMVILKSREYLVEMTMTNTKNMIKSDKTKENRETVGTQTYSSPDTLRIIHFLEIFKGFKNGQNSMSNFGGGLQLDSMAHQKKKENGERIAVLPHVNIVEYYTYEDSVVERLFGKLIRDMVLHINRRYVILQSINWLMVCICWLTTCLWFFVSISEGKQYALVICAMVGLVTNSLNVLLASYPLVQRIFKSFDGLFLLANFAGFFLGCGMLAYRINGTFHALLFLVWLAYSPQILLHDALPLKIKRINRRFHALTHGTLACTIFVTIITLNIYESKAIIDEDWFFVGPLKFSSLRTLSTFGLNTCILFARYTINSIYYSDSLCLLKSGTYMSIYE